MACTNCGGQLQSVAGEVDGQVGLGAAKIMFFVVIAFACGVGPLTMGTGWLALIVIVPIWLWLANSSAKRFRCVSCGNVQE